MRSLLGMRVWPRRRAEPSPLDVLRALVEGLPGLAALVGEDGSLHPSNAALTSRLLPAAVGSPTLPAEVAAAWRRLRTESLRTGRAATETLTWPGTAESFLTTVTPLPAFGGRPNGSFLVHAQPLPDLDHARQRTAGLESEVRLVRDILDRIPDQIYAKDADHRFVIANRAVARKVLGRDEPEALVGKTDHDLFPLADADGYRADEDRLMASGRDILDLEEKAVYQGEETWNLTSKLLRRGPDGQVEGIVGINRDVTARRRAEMALEAERALLASLMDSIPDIIFFKDRQGRFTAINAAYARLLRLRGPKDAVGRTVGDFFGAEHLRASRQEEEAIFATGRPLIGKEESVEFPAQGRRWLLVSKVPLRGPDGRLTGLVGVSRDITDRKNAEEALRRSLEEFLEVASAVSEGDLTRRGREGDDTPGQIAAEVNRMLDRIGAMLLQVRSLAEMVSTSAAEIQVASDEIARGSQRQSEDTLSTSASAEEMARSMASVAAGATEAARRAQHAEETARQGDRLAREAAEAMARIERALGASMEKMRQHERASEEILDVVETIKGFAEQTNLLSLNAAIEAARAGAAGAGFSVISAAIRELADKSADAAKDVDHRLTAMQAGNVEALAAMEATGREIETGLELVGHSLADLRTIAAGVEIVAQRTMEISTAAGEQTRVTDDIAKRVHGFAAIAAQTSAAAEETARTVTATARMADELKAALARFRLPAAGPR